MHDHLCDPKALYKFSICFEGKILFSVVDELICSAITANSAKEADASENVGR